MYAVAGTLVYSVDTSTGAATFLVDWAGQGLGVANGEAVIGGATTVPEPASLSLLFSGVGMASVWFLRRRRSNRVV